MSGCPFLDSPDFRESLLAALWHLGAGALGFFTALLILEILDEKHGLIRIVGALSGPVLMPLLPAVPLVLLLGRWGYVLSQILVILLLLRVAGHCTERRLDAFKRHAERHRVGRDIRFTEPPKDLGRDQSGL